MFDKLPVAAPEAPAFPHSFKIFDFSLFLAGWPAGQSPIFKYDYNLVWMPEGRGTLSIDSKSFLIGPNALCCIRPGQQICFTPAVPGRGFVISFSAEFIDLHETTSTELIRESLFNHFLLSPVVSLQDGTTEFLNKAAGKMLEEFTGCSAYKKEILKGFLKIFIIYASRAVQNADQPPILPKKTALVKQFYMLIEKHFATKKLVKEYAALLHVSAGYLNDAVREISGAAASYHIQQRVIREAKRRVFFEESSMKEIAFSLGFSDQAHFSKYFKNITGKNFTDFKKEIVS